MKYDESGVRMIRPPPVIESQINFKGTLPYSAIREVIRHYDDKIEFIFNEKAGLPALETGDFPSVPVVGNSQGLEKFIKFAQAHGIAVNNQSRMEGENGRQVGILVFSVILILGSLIGLICLSTYLTGQ